MEQNRQVNNGPKEINDIRIRMQSSVGKVIRYCNLIIKEKEVKELKFSAVGGAIGKVINIVEKLRVEHPGLFQVNKICTISYQVIGDKGSVLSEKLHPKYEVLLTFEEPKEKSEGFQGVLPEEERKRFNDLLTKRREERRNAP